MWCVNNIILCFHFARGENWNKTDNLVWLQLYSDAEGKKNSILLKGTIGKNGNLFR